MVTVSYFSPPDALWPLGREGATHDALDGERTACGRRIDYLSMRWINMRKPLDCKLCMRALERAAHRPKGVA